MRQSPSKRYPGAYSFRNTDFQDAIQTLKDSTSNRIGSKARFDIYRYLKLVYCVYVEWKNNGAAKRAARGLARELSIKPRRGRNSLRVLIEATLPEANHKQKSRWARALEYIYSESVPTNRFRNFIRQNGGLAGCARLAVSESPKWRHSPHDYREAAWDD